jgi:transcriptional regulator CtsR
VTGGSAGSMESAIAVDLVSYIMELGYRIQSITMDDDTTTISRLKSTVDPEIEKLSDKNHIKKYISNSLTSRKTTKLLQVVLSVIS